MAEERQNQQWWIPLLVGGLAVGTFFIGRLSAQVEYLKGKGTQPAAVQTGTQQPAAAGSRDLSISGLKAAASELGLDEGRFASCLDDGKYAQKVADDSDYGAALGVSGTPTFFINGVMLVGAQPQSEFEKVIEAELKDGSGDKVLGANTQRQQVKTAVGYVKGESTAAIKVVEFSDFECPFCARTYPTIKALMEKYGSELSVEYRHFPLSFHPSAQKAAEASECAGEQGKFWEMHDSLFEG